MNLQEKHERIIYPVVRIRTEKAGGSGTIIYSKPDPNKPDEYETFVMTCMPAKTPITTMRGDVWIKDVKVGDIVLTHKNRWRKVLKTMQRFYEGSFINLGVGSKNYRNGQRVPFVSLTPEHPVLMNIGSSEEWRQSQSIKTGDLVAIIADVCQCGELKPSFRQYCDKCRQQLVSENAQRVCDKRWSDVEKNLPRHGDWEEDNEHSPRKTFDNYILPEMKRYEENGFRCIPVGHYKVTPDFIALKDNKVIAVEIEHGRTPSEMYQWSPKDKYNGIPYYDNVVWIEKAAEKYWGLPYTISSSGFATMGVYVSSSEKIGTKVYNLEVEDDNSFVAGGIVVHNCEHVIDDAVHTKKDWDSLIKKQKEKEYLDEVNVDVFDYVNLSKVNSANVHKADIVAYDKSHDIAVLKVNSPKPFPYVAKIVDRKAIEEIKLFTTLYTSGCSLLHDPFGNSGEITSLKEIIDNKLYWMGNGNSIFGNSGGAVFLAETGEQIGITARITAIQLGFGVDVITWMGFFVAPQRIYQFFEEQELKFLYDSTDTYVKALERRAKKEKQALNLKEEESLEKKISLTDSG